MILLWKNNHQLQDALRMTYPPHHWEWIHLFQAQAFQHINSSCSWSWLTLKKILSIEKLNWTCNKQTNSNKLGPFSRVSQIVLSSRRWWWDIYLGEFFYWLVGIWQGVILTTQTFSKLKAIFNIKINMTCEYKEYKTKLVQEQWIQLKKMFLFDLTWKLSFSGFGEGMNLWWEE